MAKQNDPDGPLPKWGEPAGVKQYMKKTPRQTKTIKVGEDTVGSDKCHYALVMDRKVTATGTKEEMLARCAEEGGRVWVSTKNVGDIVEAKYSVDVDGLPRFYMEADSPAQVKIALRKLLKKASSIDSVERVHDAKIKQDLRQRIKGGETDKRNVDEEVMDEGVKHDRYMRSHGKKASGEGNWMFTTKRMGSPSEKETFSHNGKLGDGHKAAIKHFKSNNVYVMEKLDPSKHDAGDYVRDFKDSDAPQFKGKSMEKRRKMAIAAYLSARREKGLEEKYRKPTPAEIAVDKRKDQKSGGDRYKSMKKKMYGNAMGGLKEEEKLKKDHQWISYVTRGGDKGKTQVHKNNAFKALNHYRKNMKSAQLEEYVAEEEKLKKDHQFLSYVTRGGQKGKTQVHKKNAFKALNHYRKNMKSAQLETEETIYEGAKPYISTDKHGHHVMNSNQKIHKSFTANDKGFKAAQAHLKSNYNTLAKEEVELQENRMKAAKELQAYAKKNGGIDKDDFLMASQLVKDNKMRDLKKFLRSMDTDPREGVILILRRNGLKEEVMNEDYEWLFEEEGYHYVKVHGVRAGDHIIVKTKAANKRGAVANVKKQWPKDKVTYHNEEVEQVDEYITSKQIKMAKGIANDPRHRGGDMTGASRKMEKIKRGLSNHPAVKKALQSANEEVEQVSEASRDKEDYGLKIRRYEMIKKAAKKIQRKAQAASKSDYKRSDKAGMAPVKTDEGYKVPSNYAAMMLKKKKAEAKKKLSPAQSKHMDTDKDGDIDGADLQKLRNKNKS
jgi:hypothetical protein